MLLLYITYTWGSHIWLAAVLGACTLQEEHLPVMNPSWDVDILGACPGFLGALHFFMFSIELGAQVGEAALDCLPCIKRKPLYIKQIYEYNQACHL